MLVGLLLLIFGEYVIITKRGEVHWNEKHICWWTLCNKANKVLGDDLIKADLSKTENYYTITAIISNKFLKENYLSSYVYMGLVISDCSSETHHRKNELILSEESSEWYNPTYFAKIDIK